jgi:hypothetical protein
MSISRILVRLIRRARALPVEAVLKPGSQQKPKGVMTMRLMIVVKADKNSEAGMMPSKELLAEMGKYNEELAKAGVLLAAEGLHPSSKGAKR